jgi:hypothetical protein
MPQTIEDLVASSPMDLGDVERRYSEGAYAEKFEGTYQATDNWCWAAAAATVANFYAYYANTAAQHVPQCIFVDHCHLPRACDSSDRSGCRGLTGSKQSPTCKINHEMDKPNFLNLVLRRHGMLEVSIARRARRRHPIPGVTLNGAELVSGPELDFDEIKALLDHGRLVCLRRVRGKVRHFLIIYGCETYPDNDFYVWDPANGADVIEADRFEQEYGPFSHKIITRPPETVAS